MSKTKTPNEKRIYLRDVLLVAGLLTALMVVCYKVGRKEYQDKALQVLPSVGDNKTNENK